MPTRFERALQVTAIAALTCMGVASPAGADLSGFVGVVGFDSEANLNSSPAIGLRWGRAGGVFGGETSLMISRPNRELEANGEIDASDEAATAIFYEGRFLLNIPAGAVRPFVGVGFGWVTITSTDPPAGASEALSAFTDLQTNSALSYGGGIRYRLAEKLDIRVDIRQYLVFSVKDVALAVAVDQIEKETGVAPPPVEDNTVQYNELSVGVVLNF